MLEQFLQYLSSIRGYSDNTIRAYSADLRSFARWANENIEGARWSTITRDHIDAFIKHQNEVGLKPATTNRQLASISSLYNYFKRQGLNVENPCTYESRRKMAQTQPKTLKAKDIAKAWEHAHGNAKTMLGILATTGIRIQELLNLKYEDIDFEDNTLRIMGKGSKERTVSTTATVLHTLKGMRDEFDAHGRIFWMGQRTARHMIYEALFPYCKSPNLNPHTIRHTFATELAKNGESTATIAKILGHAHIETSQKYINMAELPKARYANNLNFFN